MGKKRGNKREKEIQRGMDVTFEEYRKEGGSTEKRNGTQGGKEREENEKMRVKLR